MFSGMPTNPYLYADDLNEVLKQKHAAGAYKSLVKKFKKLLGFLLMQCVPKAVFGIYIYVISRYFTSKLVRQEVFSRVFFQKA